MMKYKYDIFISYKTEEAEFAREINDFLSQKYKVFFSERTLHDKASDDFEKDIKKALTSSLILLNVGTSKESLSGEWLKKERDYFIPLRDSDKKRRIFNIVHDDYDIINNLPKDLAQWNSRKFPEQKDEILDIVKKAKELSYSAIIDFSLSNKPEELDSNYSKDIFRRKSFEELNNFFMDLKDQVGLLYIYGSGGVGKTSFITNSFLSYKNEKCKKYLYYISGNDDINEHLDKLSEALSKNFLDIASKNDLYIEFNDILRLSDSADKMKKLLYLYDKEIYKKTNIEFIVFIDAIDTLKYEKKFIRNLVNNYKGIHFIFSGRIPPNEEFFIELKSEIKSLKIFKQNDTIGLKLDNLDDQLTLEYLTQNLSSKNLSSNKQKIIKNKIISKTKGLPKYFELLLSKVNKLVDSNDPDVFDKIILEIDSAPSELMDYYSQILKSIDKENKLAMQILRNLYWHNDTGIKKEKVIEILKIDNIENFYKALKSIEYLIKTQDDNTTILLNHLSISEALFVFYAKDVHGKLSAKQLDEKYLQTVFKKDPIILYLAKYYNEIYTLLSSVYYFNNDNLLYKSLEEIVTFYTEKILQKNEDPINIYFAYSKIIFIQYMLKDILKKDDLSFTDVFTKSDSNFQRVSIFNEKVYRQYYSTSNFTDIYKLRKLVAMTMLDQNSYYQAKYLKKYLTYKYSTKYKKIFEGDKLFKKDLEGLNSNLSRTYIAMRTKLENKNIDSKLGIYEDDGLVMLYNETKSKNIYEKVFSTIKDAEQKRKTRSFIERQYRYYQIIATSSDVKLIKLFYNSIYFYAKKNNKMDKKMKEFLNSVSLNILTKNLSTLNKNDKFYKYLPSEKKQEINTIQNFYNSYKNNGIKSILKEKNHNYFDIFAKFIDDKDIKEFLEYTNNYFYQNNISGFKNIIASVVKNTNDKESLLLCKDYLEDFIDQVGDTTLLLKLYIYYKNKDLDSIVKLENLVIKQEYAREERSIISKEIGTISNGLENYLDIFSLQKSFHLKSYLRGYFKKAKYDISELSTFKKYIASEETIYNALIESIYNLTDIDKIDSIFRFLKDWELINENDEKVFDLNIKMLKDRGLFINSLKQFDYSFQLDFLNLALSPEKKRSCLDDELIKYILNIISSTKATDESVKLFTGMYYHDAVYKFALNNPQLIWSIYDEISVNEDEKQVCIKAMLYRSILVIEGESNFVNIKDQDWISDEFKVNIITSLIFLTKNMDIAVELLDVINQIDSESIDIAKILINFGLTFNDDEKLEQGVKKLIQFKQKVVGHNISIYNNYLNYTLSHLLPQDTIMLISDMFTSSNLNHYNLNYFKNIENFLYTGQYTQNIIKNSGKFVSFYTQFFDFEKELQLTDFNTILFEGDFDNYMMVMYDLYKEAELNEDEKRYEYYIKLFETFKNSFKLLFEERFDDINNITLDNYYIKCVKQDTFSIDIVKSNYQSFFNHLKDLVNKSDEKSLTIFNTIMSEIKDNEEYYSAVVENSSIHSKLQLKPINIEYFEPVE